MVDGRQLVECLQQCGVTHVVWIPDSEVGPWDAALATTGTPRLLRPTREGEAVALAGGLCLGGARPLVIIQCTGLFEAGDALRNFIHDLRLPLVLLIGVRSAQAAQAGRSSDSCPVFTEPILDAWQLPYHWLPPSYTATDLESALQRYFKGRRAGAILIPE